MASSEETTFDDEEIKKTVRTSKILMEKFDNIRDDLCKNVRAIASCKAPTGSKEKAELVTQMSVRLLEYKAACRTHFVVMDKCSKIIESKKKDLDAVQLRLQNLLYEKGHIERTIKELKAYPNVALKKINADEGETVIDVESLNRLRNKEEHEAVINRLIEEEKARKQAYQDLENLRRLRDEAAADTENLKTSLTALPSQINDLLKAINIIQTTLGIDKEDRMSRYEKAQHLPAPLHTIFKLFESYCEAFDQKRENVKLVSVKSSECAPNSFFSVVSEDHMDIVSPMAGSSKRSRGQDDGRTGSKRHHGASRSKSLEPAPIGSSEIKDLAEVAPDALRVDFTIHGSVQHVFFYFVPSFNLVFVEVKDRRLILVNLYPKDSGKSLSSPAAIHTTTNVDDYDTVLATDKAPARPYRWAQWLGGLWSCPEETKASAKGASSRAIIDRIRSRLTSSHNLDAHLRHLQVTPAETFPVHSSAFSLFPPQPKPVGYILHDFTEITAPDKAEHVFGVNMDSLRKEEGEMEIITTEGGAVIRQDTVWENFGCRYFGGTFKKATSTGFAFTVEISPEYPIRAPRFSLQNPEKDAVFENTLHSIQSEVNAFYRDLVTPDPESKDYLFVHQLRKIQACLDSIETVGSSSSMGHGALLSRVRVGKDRRRPMNFDVHARTFLHR